MDVEMEPADDPRAFVWDNFDTSQKAKKAQRKYKKNTPEFNAYLLIQDLTNCGTRDGDHLFICIHNFITVMRPDVCFKESGSERTFFTYIVRNRFINQAHKIKLSSHCFVTYWTVDFFFLWDAYEYTSFHHALVADHYKLALQILLLAHGNGSFKLPGEFTTDLSFERHQHPLTFYV